MVRVFVSVGQTAALQASKKVQFVDARWSLADPALGAQQWQTSRLPGACFFDMETMSGEITSATGRHPLPSYATWTQWLTTNALDPNAHIIAYDSQSGAFAAARLWWMMRISGFPNVHILSGGITAWESSGSPIEVGEPTKVVPQRLCSGSEWDEKAMASLEEVKNGGEGVLVDCRPAERFASDAASGPVWPDSIAGHVPGAVSHPFAANFADGMPLPKEDLAVLCKKTLGGRGGGDDVDARKAVLYCGSGVTACCTAAVMEEVGLGMPRIFVGSWSLWQKAAVEAEAASA